MWVAARAFVRFGLGALAAVAVGCASEDDATPPPADATGGRNAGGAAAGSGGAPGGAAGAAGGVASGGASGGAAGGASGGASGASGGASGQAGQGNSGLADVCPLGAPPDLPADAPRILVLGPKKSSPERIAAHLQQLLAAGTTYAHAEVVSEATDTGVGESLLSYWYVPTGRADRLAQLDGKFTWVVLLDEPLIGISVPEVSFEGVRTVACQARAQGARPLVLMTWSADEAEGAKRAEMAYRVGNGTGTPVVPTVSGAKLGPGAGSGGSGQAGAGGSPGDVPAAPDIAGPFVAAASLYGSLTGQSAAGTSYLALNIEQAQQDGLIAAADQAIAKHAAESHYQAPFASAVRLETITEDKTFTFMDSGTSSEALWQDRMNEIVPALGLAPAATAIGYCNEMKVFDGTCLTTAAASFATAQYAILFARGYSVPAATITSTGSQPHLTVQVWDRHLDNLPMDGAAALDGIEQRSLYGAQQARQYGLAWVPYHLMFAKLKAANPALQLTSDGTHATYPVGYGLAAMSLISRTSRTIPTTGLDADTTAAVRFADESIRQLAWLSQWSTFIPDDPATRPTVK